MSKNKPTNGTSTAVNSMNVFPSNLHTHTHFCDGRNTAVEYIERALEKGYESIGFSGHSYLPFGEDFCMSQSNTIAYIKEIQLLKEVYKGRIEVYLGIEADYYSGITKAKAKAMRLDYCIGSVHYIADTSKQEFYCIDGTPEEFQRGVDVLCGGDVQLFVEAYYEVVMDMITGQQPDIVGHLDLVKKLNHNNRFFNEESNWYHTMLDKVTDCIATSGAIVEINTGGIARGYTSFPYPSRFILEQLLAKRVPVTISSDAHQVSNLDYHFAEVLETIRTIGFKDVMVLSKGKFEARSLV